jgi:hypothetical protein
MMPYRSSKAWQLAPCSLALALTMTLNKGLV